MWKKYNPNPLGKSVGDCSIRAVSKVMNQSWVWTYTNLCVQGLLMGDMPNSDNVWGAFLRSNGFKRYAIPNSCPDCYTVADFAEDHPEGVYAVGTGSHVVAVVNGNYFDSWDSGSEVPIFIGGKMMAYNANSYFPGAYSQYQYPQYIPAQQTQTSSQSTLTWIQGEAAATVTPVADTSPETAGDGT